MDMINVLTAFITLIALLVLCSLICSLISDDNISEDKNSQSHPKKKSPSKKHRIKLSERQIQALIMYFQLSKSYPESEYGKWMSMIDNPMFSQNSSLFEKNKEFWESIIEVLNETEHLLTEKMKVIQFNKEVE